MAALTKAWASDLSLPDDHQGAALAASATQAILLDLADLAPGPQHSASVDLALAMLAGLSRALSREIA